MDLDFIAYLFFGRLKKTFRGIRLEIPDQQATANAITQQEQPLNCILFRPRSIR